MFTEVTPHVGVWIETVQLCWKTALRLSLPMWECGLKLVLCLNTINLSFVTPHVGVWIETSSSSIPATPAWSLPMWECGLKPALGILQW